jgi:hypothetical protein
MANRPQRRDCSETFKADAVRLVQETGKTLSAVARELDLTESALRQWVAISPSPAGWRQIEQRTFFTRQTLGVLCMASVSRAMVS